MEPVQTVRLITDLPTFNPHLGAAEERTAVYVQGYYLPGDGGGGLFNFIRTVPTGALFGYGAPTPDPPDAQGIFIASTVTENDTYEKGIWVRSFSGYIDVRFFGAMGLYDDYTDRIQRAINIAAQSIQHIDYPHGGGTRPLGYNNTNTVFIPNGVYYIRKLTMRTGVRLLGGSISYTQIQSVYDDNSYLIELDNVTPDPYNEERIGVTRDIHIEGMTFYGNVDQAEWDKKTHKLTKTKGCFGFVAENKKSPGIWDSVFRDINIQGFTGHSIVFQGGIKNDDWSMPMQFITMEGVQVESIGQLRKKYPDFKNEHHALMLLGSCGQFSLTNCRFDGSSFPANPNDPDFDFTTTNIYIGTDAIPAGHEGVLLPHPSVITFNTCTVQMGAIGVIIESSSNIKFDSCWFERFERAIIAKGRFAKSKSINILNCMFGYCAGNYGIESEYPPGNGRVIIAQNSQMNIHNNSVGDLLQNEPVLFIGADTEKVIIDGKEVDVPARNIGINASCNYFERQFKADPADNIYLGYTNGLKRDLNITSLTDNFIHLQNAKTIYLRNDSGIEKTIDVIYSFSVGGEYLFIRSDQGTVNLTESGNLYLGNRGAVKLNNGDVALFVKIDEEVHTGAVYYETYNLITVLPRV